jgi:hypothetical protein
MGIVDTALLTVTSIGELVGGGSYSLTLSNFKIGKKT